MADQCPQMVKLLMLIPHCAGAGESTLDCLEQRVLGNRLRQEVLRAGFDDPNGRWDVCLACQKNDGQAQSSCLQTRPAVRARSCQAS